VVKKRKTKQDSAARRRTVCRLRREPTFLPASGMAVSDFVISEPARPAPPARQRGGAGGRVRRNLCAMRSRTIGDRSSLPGHAKIAGDAFALVIRALFPVAKDQLEARRPQPRQQGSAVTKKRQPTEDHQVFTRPHSSDNRVQCQSPPVLRCHRREPKP
jgi:hypothetical protein